MTATVVVKVGPVKANFSGKVTLSDIDAPNGYRISGEGSGGVAGFAKGGATVKLTAEGPESTRLDYAVDAQIGGKLAQLGGRLIDATAKKLAGEFFEKFAAELSPPTPDASARRRGDGGRREEGLVQEADFVRVSFGQAPGAARCRAARHSNCWWRKTPRSPPATSR